MSESALAEAITRRRVRNKLLRDCQAMGLKVITNADYIHVQQLLGNLGSMMHYACTPTAVLLDIASQFCDEDLVRQMDAAFFAPKLRNES